MFTTFVLIYAILLVSASTAPPALNITNEACQNGGLWTEWFSMYNSENSANHDPQNTDNIVKNVANASCSAIIEVYMEQIQGQANSGFMSAAIASQTAVGDFLSSYVEVLSQIDFRLRFCCLGGFPGMTPRPSTSPTEEIHSTVIPSTTDNPTMHQATMPFSTMPAGNGSCGKQQIAPRPSLTPRIFGGTDAIAHSWPWVSH